MPPIRTPRLLIATGLLAIAACQGRDTPLAPPSKLAVPGGGLPGFPGTVTDLAVDAVTRNSATLSFTEVDDGLGQPARYVVRFAEPPIEWGSARDVTEGTCARPVIGQAIGARLTCTVLGLAPATTYEFQVVAYRSTLDLVETFGDPSNVGQGTTAASCDCWTEKADMPTWRTEFIRPRSRRMIRPVIPGRRGRRCPPCARGWVPPWSTGFSTPWAV